MEHIFKHSSLTLETVAKLIKNECGLHFPPNHLKVLDQRIAVTLREMQCSEFDFVTLLQQDHDELLKFISHVTTNFTQFFRSIEQFHALGDIILPIITEEKPLKKHIKIWSAACSSGEEPYSLALYIKHFLQQHKLHDWTFSVLASDISDTELEKAQKGVYEYHFLKNIPNMYHKDINIIEGVEYAPGFQEGASISIADSIKSYVTFKYQNLLIESPEEDFDIIFCRNVLIYFDLPTQEKVIHNLTKALKPDRFLFISPSESLSPLETTLQVYMLPTCVFYKNEAPHA